MKKGQIKREKLTIGKINELATADLSNNIRKIFNHLLLNVSYLNDCGLYYGKTGCLLFLARYAHRHESEINDEVVSELIDDIFSAVPKIPLLGMQHGICGIGWGVEYILQNGLLEGDSDDILGDLDKLIVKKGAKPIANSPECADVLRYIAVRLTSSSAETNLLPFPTDYLTELCDFINQSSRPMDVAMQNDISVIKKSVKEGRFSLPPIRLSDEMMGEASLTQFPLVQTGLHNGLSGLGIKWLLENQNNGI